MAEEKNKFQQRLEEIEQRQQEKLSFLGQFWIWRPYSKHSLSEIELRNRGFENLAETDAKIGRIHNES